MDDGRVELGLRMKNPELGRSIQWYFGWSEWNSVRSGCISAYMALVKDQELKKFVRSKVWI